MSKLDDVYSSEDEEETAHPDSYFSAGKIPTYKVILLGEVGSGKTSLFLRYKYGSFRHGTSLQGSDRYQKEYLNDNGQKVQMVLWDTAGMERMGSLTFHYYHGAHAVILVFAIDDYSTFDSLTSWHDDTSRYSPTEVKRFLVATKTDVDEDQIDVPKEKINSFCRNNKIAEIYYTSAKTGEGVEEMFHCVINSISKAVGAPTQDPYVVAFPPKMANKKKKCVC